MYAMGYGIRTATLVAIDDHASLPKAKSINSMVCRKCRVRRRFAEPSLCELPRDRLIATAAKDVKDGSQVRHGPETRRGCCFARQTAPGRVQRPADRCTPWRPAWRNSFRPS